MNEQYIRERISDLRMKKRISEYRMSLDLGHSKSYIQSISSGKSLPSMSEFLYICDYLQISPSEFFDNELVYPSLVKKLLELTKKLDEEELELLIALATRFSEQKNKT